MTELAERRPAWQSQIAPSEVLQKRLLVVALIVGDALALVAGFGAAYELRFYWRKHTTRLLRPSSQTGIATHGN